MMILKANQYSSLRILSTLNNKVGSVNTTLKKVTRELSMKVDDYQYTSPFENHLDYPSTVTHHTEVGTSPTRGEVVYATIDQLYTFQIPTKVKDLSVQIEGERGVGVTPSGYWFTTGTGAYADLHNDISYSFIDWVNNKWANSCRSVVGGMFVPVIKSHPSRPFPPTLRYEIFPWTAWPRTGNTSYGFIPDDERVDLTCTNVSPYAIRLYGVVPIYSLAVKAESSNQFIHENGRIFENFVKLEEWKLKSFVATITADSAATEDIQYSSGEADPLELISNELMQQDAAYGATPLSTYLRQKTADVSKNKKGRLLVEFVSYESIELGESLQLLDVFGNPICSAATFQVVSIDNNITSTHEKRVRALEV